MQAGDLLPSDRLNIVLGKLYEKALLRLAEVEERTEGDSAKEKAGSSDRLKGVQPIGNNKLQPPEL